MDTSTRTVATLVDTSISSAGSQDLPESLNTPVSHSTTHVPPALAGSQDLPESLNTPVSHSTTHITPALAARPPPPAVIRPIFSPRVPKAFSSQKELTYESKYAQSELVVKRSLVQVDGHFTEQGLYRGWGLFTPSQHRSRGMCVSVYVCVCVCATVADRMHVCVHNVHVHVNRKSPHATPKSSYSRGSTCCTCSRPKCSFGNESTVYKTHSTKIRCLCRQLRRSYASCSACNTTRTNRPTSWHKSTRKRACWCLCASLVQTRKSRSTTFAAKKNQ